MPPEAVYAVILVAALAHASWNGLVKSSGNGLMMIAAIRFVGLVIGAALLVFVPFPAPESWPFLGAAALAHYAYYSFLANGYRVGDLSQVYPIARGSAPLLVALVGIVAVGERLGPWQGAAVAMISLGIVALAFGRRGAFRRDAVLFALATGTAIATYTVFGAIGVRRAETVLGFVAVLEILTGFGTVAWIAMFRSAAVPVFVRAHGRTGAVAGVLATGGYMASLWAMTLLPMATVAALRETSVIFAALIGVVVFREGLGVRRVAAAGLVAAGIVALTGFGGA